MSAVVTYNTKEFSEKIFHYGDRRCLVVPKHIEHWDNFHMEPYAEYVHRKMLYKLRNINLN